MTETQSLRHFRRHGITPICGAVPASRADRLALTIDLTQVTCPACKQHVELRYQSKRFNRRERDYR